MMWFTADLHLGDTNILHDMDRPFDSVEEMNRKVIDAINECVAADDRLYILGDFTYLSLIHIYFVQLSASFWPVGEGC